MNSPALWAGDVPCLHPLNRAPRLAASGTRVSKRDSRWCSVTACAVRSGVLALFVAPCLRGAPAAGLLCSYCYVSSCCASAGLLFLEGSLSRETQINNTDLQQPDQTRIPASGWSRRTEAVPYSSKGSAFWERPRAGFGVTRLRPATPKAFAVWNGLGMLLWRGDFTRMERSASDPGRFCDDLRSHSTWSAAP